MPKSLLLLALLLTCWSAQAQRITGYQLLPANATPNDNLRLVLTVYYGNCSGNYGYTVTRTNSQLALKGCYGSLGVTSQCTLTDTVALGKLPAGSYSVTTGTYIMAPNTTSCATSSPSNVVNATTSFTVLGTALAARLPLDRWQLAPTVLPVAAATLHLADAPALQLAIVYDVAGREQRRYSAAELSPRNGNVQLALPTAAPGLYLLRVFDASGQASTRRFVRQ
ncbi:MAG: hypothetical protein EOO59_13910 [Hymenobacter sp.]|nr:MAG: hypothetical protein EOO59_13910 [Hymenobacter sp.]